MASCINEHKDFVEKYGKINRVYHSTDKQKMSFKYVFRCKECGRLIAKKRTCAFVKEYKNKRCGKDGCKGHFEQIKGPDKSHQKVNYKYIIACVDCNKQYKRKTKSVIIKSPHKYRCSECKGGLKRIK
jgi:predicted SprT family Zn-dependent metalloprotease